MKIKLWFMDWNSKEHKSVYCSNIEIERQLKEGLFHSGTLFNADIDLDEESEQELKDALANGYYPIFGVAKHE